MEVKPIKVFERGSVRRLILKVGDVEEAWKSGRVTVEGFDFTLDYLPGWIRLAKHMKCYLEVRIYQGEQAEMSNFASGAGASFHKLVREHGL